VQPSVDLIVGEARRSRARCRRIHHRAGGPGGRRRRRCSCRARGTRLQSAEDRRDSGQTLVRRRGL